MHKRKLSFITMGLALLCAIGTIPVHAQEADTNALSRGKNELSLAISPDFSAANGDDLRLHIGYGRFVRDGLSIGVTANLVIMEDIAPPDDDYRAQEIDFTTEYHFRRGRDVVPYLGLDVGWRKSKFGVSEESAMVVGPRFGLKYFLTDSVAVDFGLAYKFSNKNVFISDYQAEDHYAAVSIGLRAYF